MIVFRYGATELNLIGEYSIKKSSQDVTFSDITCDFTGHKKEDLPIKYQEAQLVDNETGEVSFTGYIESYDFGDMREVDVDREINISLLSPMSLTTLRSTIAVGNYMLKDLIQNTILSSMIDDGFSIVEMNIADREISVNFLMETVEYCMNILSNKYNFWWYIDENKNIYIRDIDYMFNLEPKITYDNETRPKGLEYIKPKISATDYYNVVNFKNVRVYEQSIYNDILAPEIIYDMNKLFDNKLKIENGTQVNFNFPVDIKKENILKSYNTKTTALGRPNPCGIYCMFKDSSEEFVIFRIEIENDKLVISDNISFQGDGQEQKEFELIRDSFFSNLITGFIYHGTSTLTPYIYESDSILAWNVIRFFHSSEIQSKKNIINKSGVVEKIVDMNEQWKTIPELQEIAVSSINNNVEQECEVEIQTDDINGLTVGDLFRINKGDFLIDGDYVITSINEQVSNNDIEYNLTLKNTNMLDSYIDIFRSKEEQQSDDKIYNVSVIDYVEDNIKEIHEVV